MKKKYYLLLFIACLISRLCTTIFYIEDPDSLHFALAIKNYDLTLQQPHFPGYPVFCFLVKIIYFFTGSIPYSFSIIGGMATFVLIKYTVRLAKEIIPGVNELLLSALLFINPLLWLLSNRYMPDLTGLALLMVCCYLFIRIVSKRSNVNSYNYHFLAGLLAGVRLSYLPFLLVPSAYLIFTKENFFKQTSCFVVGILTWLVPLMLETGWQELWNVAQMQSEGHFYEWGETILTGSHYWLRLEKIIETTWADGFGGFMFNRAFYTVLISTGLVLGGLIGLKKLNPGKDKATQNIFIVFLFSLLCYFLWIYFYQNVIYQSRHILPFIPFVTIIIALGLSYLMAKKNLLYRGFIIVFFSGNLIFTLGLTNQHIERTAIANAANYFQSLNLDNNSVIYTTSLVRQYLSAHKNINTQFVEHDQSENEKILQLKQKGLPIYSTHNIDKLIGEEAKKETVFYHNPYINRVWPKVVIYEY